MGEFILGTNYWASHAGTDMWKDWQVEVVKKDLSVLRCHGIKYLWKGTPSVYGEPLRKRKGILSEFSFGKNAAGDRRFQKENPWVGMTVHEGLNIHPVSCPAQKY